MASLNASLLNSEAMQIGGVRPTQENGIRMIPHPMFKAIPGTRGLTNSLFEFILGGLEGFPTIGRDTSVPAPFAGPFAGQAQRGHLYPQQQPAL